MAGDCAVAGDCPLAEGCALVGDCAMAGLVALRSVEVALVGSAPGLPVVAERVLLGLLVRALVLPERVLLALAMPVADSPVPMASLPVVEPASAVRAASSSDPVLEPER